MDIRRKEIDTKCQRLEEVISTFQDRVGSSTLRLQQFDAHRQDISSKIEVMFTEAEKLLKDRKEQILSELEAMAKEDKRVLEEQQVSDQSLLSEAQAKLEGRKRFCREGLPSQLLPGPQDMGKIFDDLETRSSRPQNPGPVYKVDGCIDVLTAAVNKMGNIKRKAVFDGADDQSYSDLNPSKQSKRQNRRTESEEKQTAPPVTQPASQQLLTKETVQAVDVKAGGKGESHNTSTGSSRSPPQCVGVLALPRSSGAFKDHLDAVTRSVLQEVQHGRKVSFATWSPEQRIVLIVFLAQGSPGVEFPGALPQELIGSSQRVVVVVIQDDETSAAGRDIVPENLRSRLLGVVNVHVIPMQHQLHRCARNQQAVKEIARLLSS